MHPTDMLFNADGYICKVLKHQNTSSPGDKLKMKWVIVNSLTSATTDGDLGDTWGVDLDNIGSREADCERSAAEWRSGEGKAHVTAMCQ